MTRRTKTRTGWLQKLLYPFNRHPQPEKVRANSIDIRFPYQLFNGAVIPKRYIMERLRVAGKKAPKVLPNHVRFNRRFRAKQMEDGNYIVYRNGSVLPACATYLSKAGWWTKPAKLAS